MHDSSELNNVALQVGRKHLDYLNFPCVMLRAVCLLRLQRANISAVSVSSDTRCECHLSGCSPFHLGNAAGYQACAYFHCSFTAESLVCVMGANYHLRASCVKRWLLSAVSDVPALTVYNGLLERLIKKKTCKAVLKKFPSELLWVLVSLLFKLFTTIIFDALLEGMALLSG